ncbi:hypothetical protein [Brevibacillus dissolubilis]|uniref:hypothetical protein n=1 Tax=Brevibacillus dissolubilis TaxID=1844116 RepID=UPI00159B8801|nr:hypothetical protein [Brevibacillus dissolubilis]
MSFEPRKVERENFFYTYRHDIASLLILFAIIVAMVRPLFSAGHIVFSDMAFGFTSERYMEEIFGVWNERWSTSTLFNVPRLLFILPFYLLSVAFGYSGPVLIKSFITALLLLSAFSMYWFTKRLVSIYFSKHFTFITLFGIITGALFYALNPWVIYRIQHIYLLCGYSLFPLVLMFFFNAFDPKFQRQLIHDYDVLKPKLYRRNVVDMALLSIVFTLCAAAIHYFFYGMIYLVLLSALIIIKTLITDSGRKWGNVWKIMKHFAIRYVVFGLLFGLYSFYWLSMYAGSILFKAQASQHNINVVDTLSLFSRHSSIENVVYLISYWWPMFQLNTLPVTFWIGGGVLLLAILYAMVFRAYRNPIILFFTLSAIVFIVLATGVTYSAVADWFVLIVTKTPLIGPVFRDPNKFGGLLAVNFGVLLSFGVVHFLQSLKNNIYHRLIKYASVLAIVVCFWMYILPFHQHFIAGFYKPVPIPEEYLDVQDHMIEKERFDSRVLYFPIADNMIQSYTGVATPSWNQNPDPYGIHKATGDVHVYTSQKNTIFHHEGNSLSIGYYMNFLQYLMDKGQSNNLAELFSAFGINELSYHKEYKGQEIRQKFHEQLLDSQDGWDKHYENPIFQLYALQESLRRPYIQQVPHKIFSPYGYSRMESYNNLPNYQFNDYGVIFTTLDETPYLHLVDKADYIEVNRKMDLLLSNLPKDNLVLPFEAIEDGNPFLKWSKTLVKNSDWLWFLSSQNIKNFPFDFDYGAGVGVTFAPNKLDVLPYKMKEMKGDLIVDFDTLLRKEKFFVPDNEELFTVEANPRGPANNISTLHGEIVRGDPKNIWQVAKSGLLDAKENNPYQFSITVSGRGTNKLHLKVIFFDEQMKELGTSYVVAPTEESNFDALEFYGEYVSPKGSKYMRIDLLSYQKPVEKTYWWIHDMKLYDLEKYRKPNTFTMYKKFEKETKAHVYIRTFKSQKGGELKVTLPDSQTATVDTKEETLNQFVWDDLGVHTFAEGEQPITVENLEGFNGVNLLAVVPVDEYDKQMKVIDDAVQTAKVFAVLEAENDFEKSSGLQTERAFPKLSYGKGISLQQGSLTRDLDIVKDASYTLALQANAIPAHNGSIKVTLTNQETGQKLSYPISSQSFKQKADTSQVVIDYNLFRDTFPQEFRELPGYFDHTNTIELKDIPLTKGAYQLEIAVDSRVPSVSTFADLHRLDPSEIKADPAPATGDPVDQDCCECVKNDPNLLRQHNAGDLFTITYPPSCSCDWFITASKKIPVQPDDEYLFHADAVSQNIRKRHMKIVFLNEHQEIVDTTYINDVEEKDKDRWNTYEQIIRVPQKAKTMQVHILARGHQSESGKLEIKNYSLIPYKEMIMIDQVALVEGGGLSDFFPATSKHMPVGYERVDTMKRVFTVENPAKERILLSVNESPNPLWEMTFGDKQRGTLVVNGVTTGYITNQDGAGEISIVLRKIYYGGFLVLLAGFAVTYWLYRYVGPTRRIRKRGSKKKSKTTGTAHEHSIGLDA